MIDVLVRQQVVAHGTPPGDPRIAAAILSMTAPQCMAAWYRARRGRCMSALVPAPFVCVCVCSRRTEAQRTGLIRSQREFCAEVELNEAGFAQWLQGERTSAACVRAVREFFLVHATGRVADEDAESDWRASVRTTAEAVERVQQRAGGEPPLFCVFFVDLDNSGSALSVFARAAPAGVEDSWSAHVVGTIAKGRASAKTMGFEARRWFTLVEARSALKDAADHAVTVQAVLLDRALPRNVEFVFVSLDAFAQTVSLELQPLHERSCRALTPVRALRAACNWTRLI